MKKFFLKSVLLSSLTCFLPIGLCAPYFVNNKVKNKNVNNSYNLEFINNLEENSNRDFIKTKENIYLIEDYIKFSINSNKKTKNKNNDIDRNIDNFVLEKSLNYLEKYKNNEFGIKDLLAIADNNNYSLSDMQNNIYDYKNNYYINNNFNQNIRETSSIQEISYILESMKTAGINSASFGAASLALAAGYWAASWFFGITTASAISATIQSVAFFVESGIYFGIYYSNINDPRYLNIKFVNAFESVGTLVWVKDAVGFPSIIKEWISSIRSAINTIKIVSIGLNSTIIATSWASPVGLMFLATSEIVISICDLIINSPWS